MSLTRSGSSRRSGCRYDYLLIEPPAELFQYGAAYRFAMSDQDEADELDLKGHVTAKSSPNLARDNINMAVMFGEKAKAIEDTYTTRVAMVEAELDEEVKKIGDVLTRPLLKKREYRFYATASVIASFAFVEACINELLYQMTTDDGLTPAIQNDPAIQIIQEYLNLEHMPTLKKYNMMLYVYEEPPFDTGQNPYQDVNSVRRLRNALMHHSPQFDRLSARDLDQYMGDELHGKFDKNPFAPDGGLFFPYRCMGYGCAEWALESCVAFTEEFYDRVNVNKPYRIPNTEIL